MKKWGDKHVISRGTIIADTKKQSYLCVVNDARLLPLGIADTGIALPSLTRSLGLRSRLLSLGRIETSFILRSLTRSLAANSRYVTDRIKGVAQPPGSESVNVR